MGGTKDYDIASFKSSDVYQLAKERMRMFFLRGNNVDPDYLKTTGTFKKVIEVNSNVQVINILGYVLNKPIANFDDLPAEKLKKLLWTGDVCFIHEKSREGLEKVVRQMKSFRFELIPLIVYKNRRIEEMSETVLIKVHGRYDITYVDICGRIYSSFKDFLATNVLPESILCYPKNGVVSFDADNEIDADCSVVGRQNASKGGLDFVIGMVGAVGTIGSIFATGGLALPFALVAGGSAVYTTGRSIEKLVDAGSHGLSTNPFEDAEARNNWLMMSANLLTFASLGASGLATKLQSTSQAGRLMLANRIIRGVSASVNAVTVLDSVVFMVNNWHLMSIHEKLSVACAVCFCFRQVISFANAERLIRSIEIDGICKFFRGCAESIVGGASFLSDWFIINCKKLFSENDEFAATGMHLIRTIVRDALDVTISDDFWTIRLFGFEFKMRNVISMSKPELNKFLYMIQGITMAFRDGFSLLRTICGDGPIAQLAFKRAEESGGNRADYGVAINELIEVFMIVRRISADFSILTDAKLSIGSGHNFTVASAYRTFVKGKGLSLLRTLIEMKPEDIRSMNRLRQIIGDSDIFAFITHSSSDHSKMMVKIRFLLNVFDICTEKSLRITSVKPTEQVLEIESKILVAVDQFNRSAYPSYLIDPKLFQICRPALANHREFLGTIWNNTCVESKAIDRAFEKLTVMDKAFKSYSPTTIENVISYASSMECPDLARFTNHVVFALKTVENMTREMGHEAVAVNDILFPDPASLRSRFLELTMKAEQLSLGGYCPMDESVIDYPSQLIEMIQELASSARLRFGTIENGACHMNMYPMLRIRSEIGKFNRYIALKKFDQEVVEPIYDGKCMVYLGNKQLQIVIGVVRGLGAYIDTFSITQSN